MKDLTKQYETANKIYRVDENGTNKRLSEITHKSYKYKKLMLAISAN